MATFSSNIFIPQYKDDEIKTRTRTIGLELELVVDKDDCVVSRKYMNEHTDWDNGPKQPIDFIKQINMDDAIPAVGFDGNDLEFVTHPDSISFYKEGGSERFKKAIKYLKENTATGDCALNSGTHINIGKLKNEDVEYTMDNAYWICMNFASQLQKLAGRVTMWAKFFPYMGQREFAVSTDNKHITLMRSRKPDSLQPAPKGGLKSQSLVMKKHVYEFRMFKSSNDLEELLAWVELCYNIINLGAGAKELDKIRFTDIITGEFIDNYAHKLTGERKLSTQELSASIQNTLSFESMTTGKTILLKEEQQCASSVTSQKE